MSLQVLQLLVLLSGGQGPRLYGAGHEGRHTLAILGGRRILHF